MIRSTIAFTALTLLAAPALSQQDLSCAGCKTEYYLIQHLAKTYKKQTKAAIKAGKTGNKKAAELLQSGKLDFAFTCKPAAKLIKKLKLDKKKTADWKSFEIAKDPIVIVADRNCGVTNLTLEELKSVFLGKVTNWKELGGKDLAIKPASLSNEVESGAVMVFKETTIGAKAKMAKSVKRLAAPSFLGNFCKKTPGGITFMSLASYRPSSGSMLSIDGNAPERKVVLANKYPIVATYYLTYAAKEEAKLKPFFDFVCSAEGSKLIDAKFIASGMAAPKKKQDQAAPGK